RAQQTAQLLEIVPALRRVATEQTNGSNAIDLQILVPACDNVSFRKKPLEFPKHGLEWWWRLRRKFLQRRIAAVQRVQKGGEGSELPAGKGVAAFGLAHLVQR